MSDGVMLLELADRRRALLWLVVAKVPMLLLAQMASEPREEYGFETQRADDETVNVDERQYADALR